MREGRVSQEPEGKRAAHNIGVETSRLSVMSSGTMTAAARLFPAEADGGVVQGFRPSQFYALRNRLVERLGDIINIRSNDVKN